ncbi:hypothetical protein SAMN02800694_2165 [Luteibacter sp. UNCMF331Sha3.1]|uniref:hypothetical protein n=1 Tax=Luteibacter sp. UNCMF331Sha3.1 TaxID=1502760 RepID=UPI0008AD0468|nr:hypothetical protein [Luteibacter sp. UNCMF331Sha3.1]SEM92614.1 hypothetical protein SAMN02800694_2165 [Luteibacter sp. UNCMF331Sha3.1]
MNSSDTPPSFPGQANTSDSRAQGHFFHRRPIPAFAALVLTTLVVWILFAPGLGGGFIFDDYPNIVDNALVQPKHASFSELTAAALSSPSSELKRPLASLSFATNVLASGLDASAMKATNILLHLLNGWLVFFLCRLLMRRVHSGDSSMLRDVLAFAAALAWLVAPINLTAVLYVVQRMESLANLFVLAGLIGYVRLRTRSLFGPRDAALCALWLLICTGGGLLAKETAVLLPLYALCVEAIVFRFATDRPQARKSLYALYIVILVIPMLAGAVWIVPSVLDDGTWATRDFTLRTRLLSESRVVLDYIAWTIVPMRDSLSFYHDAFIQSTGWLSPYSTLASFVALLGIGWLLWIVRRKAPLVTLGGSWFFACHTLTGTVLPLELIYEHRNYFASLGIVLAVLDGLRYASSLLAAKARDHRALCMAPAVIGLCLLGWSAVLTARTALAWGSPLSLAEELAIRGPESPRAQYELGRAYIIASRYDVQSPFVPKARIALEGAAALPGSSVLAEQALIYMYGRMNLPVQPSWWASMQGKLSRQPVSVQDDSALISLASCVEQALCHFDTDDLDKTFKVALSKPSPSARLSAAYGMFAGSILRDDGVAFRMAAAAVAAAPNEPAYRIHYIRALIRRDDLDEAGRQLATLETMNFGGRLTADIGTLGNDLKRRIEARPETPSAANEP